MRPFTFSLVTLAVLAAQGASGQANAAPAVSIKSVEFTDGSICSKADTSHSLSPSGDFELTFTNLFAAAASPGPNATSVCGVVVSVQPPRGFALAISGATLEGAARAQNAQASVNHSYFIETSSGKFSEWANEWTTNETVWNPDDIDDEGKDRSILQGFKQKFGPGFGPDNAPPEWQGECGAPTKVKGNLTLTADVTAGGSAEIFADRSLLPRTGNPGRAGTSSLHWDWELVPCTGGDTPPPTPPTSSGLDGAWRFSYLAPSGRTLSGRMVVSGSTGTYRAQGQSWTGNLKDLRAEAGSVKGKWEALNLKGSVEFKPSGDGRSFKGQYTQDGSTDVRFWNLEKE